MTPYIIGAILCIVFIYLGLSQCAKRKEPECRTCRYNNWGECENKILCESGEMWEER